jgi:hypothetical protein
MIGRLRSSEFYNTWKDADAAFFVILSQYLPGGTERNHEKSQVRMAGV